MNRKSCVLLRMLLLSTTFLLLEAMLLLMLLLLLLLLSPLPCGDANIGDLRYLSVIARRRP